MIISNSAILTPCSNWDAFLWYASGVLCLPCTYALPFLLAVLKLAKWTCCLAGVSCTCANLVCALQELLKKGVSKRDCQTALEGVFGESSRGRVRVNLEDLTEEDAGTPTLFGTEGACKSTTCF